ncbi:MAG: hypothetical protein L0387_33525 [Acidobacteria bacterium]|nr:hypothetical protein [Acidobacteriota bacterium]MCI0721937.1 hypothetical protein [Acidobacteriota bacterium]
MMAYTKPEIAPLGDAAHTVEELGKPCGPVMEEASGTWNIHPAYDLDD